MLKRKITYGTLHAGIDRHAPFQAFNRQQLCGRKIAWQAFLAVLLADQLNAPEQTSAPVT